METGTPPAPINAAAPGSAPVSVSGRARCLNCGSPLGGRFCTDCGQAASTRRLSLPVLLRGAVSSIASLDSAVLRTAVALTTRPGTFVREYLAGRRAGYASPLRYYVVVVVANVAVGALIAHTRVSPVRVEGTGTFLDENLVALQISLVYALLMLPLASTLHLLHRRRSDLTFAEHAAFAFYLLAHSILAVLLTRVVLSLVGRPLVGDVEGLVWLTAFSLLLVGAGRSFHRIPFWRALGQVVAAYLAVLLLLAVVGVVAQLVLTGTVGQ